MKELELQHCGHPRQCIGGKGITHYCRWCVEVAELERRLAEAQARAYDDEQDELILRSIGEFMEIAGQSIAVAFMEKRVDTADFHGVVMPLRNAFHELTLFLYKHRLNQLEKGEIRSDIYGPDKPTMTDALAQARAEALEEAALVADGYTIGEIEVMMGNEMQSAFIAGFAAGKIAIAIRALKGAADES